MNAAEVQRLAHTILTAAAGADEVDATTKSISSILSRWLQQQHNHVLHRGDWKAKEIDEWLAATVDDTQQYWCDW